MINLIDGNNHVRRLYERNKVMSVLRSIQLEVQALARSAPVTIVAWDGFNANKYRRDIWPKYKVGRNVPDKSVFGVFDACKKMFFHMGLHQIEIDGYEADDVIATIVQSDPTEIKHIYSTDMDLAGFGIPTELQKQIPPRLRLYKTLVGDNSDKIPGVPGFGPAKWDALDPTVKDMLEDYLKGESSILPDQFAPHIENLQKFWKIIGFRPLEEEEVLKNIVPGKFNPKLIEQVLNDHQA